MTLKFLFFSPSLLFTHFFFSTRPTCWNSQKHRMHPVTSRIFALRKKKHQSTPSKKWAHSNQGLFHPLNVHIIVDKIISAFPLQYAHFRFHQLLSPLTWLNTKSSCVIVKNFLDFNSDAHCMALHPIRLLSKSQLVILTNNTSFSVRLNSLLLYEFRHLWN